MSESTAATSLVELLSSARVVVACGPGGVGKTTTSAALALGVALRMDRRVLVLTIDPARRLADALGLPSSGNEVVAVGPEFFASLDRVPKGTLSVAMLDAAMTWDALIRRAAGSASDAAEIIANPLYKNLTARFARGHEFIAMERLYELDHSGEFDLMILDTPPSQGVVDFLDAPARMGDFFSSRLLSWLTAPLRSRLVNLASRPFTLVADRILGTDFLSSTGRFFLLLQNMYDGFVLRARRVQQLLAASDTMFLIVTTPEQIPLEESLALADEIERRNLALGALVANKVLPDDLRDPRALYLAHSLATPDSELVARLCTALLGEESLARRVLKEVGENYVNWSTLATTQGASLDELALRHQVARRLPDLLDDVVDIGALARIADLLFDDDAAD